jgi:hypothetical protein
LVEVGSPIPQNRLRILFIGVRHDLKVLPQFPHSPFSGALPLLERRVGGEFRKIASYLPTLSMKTVLARIATPLRAMFNDRNTNCSPRRNGGFVMTQSQAFA